ncbi:hypothetical protein CHS0354_006401 [Potamilus streckersoni]|uniref:Uncharacterized protein n=1 Tax=Potamilus streckersoni TaxID=2493646 RepID=A0AAE0T9B7_9BIVA|nr:hypothetical protein CHS0354_006401 [Potamilus streckersoni]
MCLVYKRERTNNSDDSFYLKESHKKIKQKYYSIKKQCVFRKLLSELLQDTLKKEISGMFKNILQQHGSTQMLMYTIHFFLRNMHSKKQKLILCHIFGLYKI